MPQGFFTKIRQDVKTLTCEVGSVEALLGVMKTPVIGLEVMRQLYWWFTHSRREKEQNFARFCRECTDVERLWRGLGVHMCVRQADEFRERFGLM